MPGTLTKLERQRALALLADGPDGCTEAALNAQWLDSGSRPIFQPSDLALISALTRHHAIYSTKARRAVAESSLDDLILGMREAPASVLQLAGRCVEIRAYSGLPWKTHVSDAATEMAKMRIQNNSESPQGPVHPTCETLRTAVD